MVKHVICSAADDMFHLRSMHAPALNPRCFTPLHPSVPLSHPPTKSSDLQPVHHGASPKARRDATHEDVAVSHGVSYQVLAPPRKAETQQSKE